jgi:CheY-like chemotaxis protein
MNRPEATILLVEDDANDVFFFKMAFEEAGISNPLHVVADGTQAINYLAGKDEFADRARFPLPYLILLDLKLPVRMGFDVLDWIRTQPDLCSLLVIVLTSSANLQDVNEAYRRGARAYLVKPLTLEKRRAMAAAIKSFWLEFNTPPSHPSPKNVTRHAHSPEPYEEKQRSRACPSSS